MTNKKPQINVSPYAQSRRYRRAATDGWDALKAKKRAEHQKRLEAQRVQKQQRISAKAEERRQNPRAELVEIRARKAEKARKANEAKQHRRAERHMKYVATHA